MSKALNHTHKQTFRTIWQVGLKLFVICVVAALSLGIVNQFTGTAIKERLQLDKENTIKNVANGKTIGEVKNTGDKIIQVIYPVLNNGQVTAYILEMAGTGYGGELKIIAMYEPSGKILSAQLIEHNETPGLGDKAENPAYMKKFLGTGSNNPVPITKEMLAKRDHTNRLTYQRPSYNSFSEWLFGSHNSLTDTGTLDSVTGATITFKGIAQALASGALYVRNIRGNR